MLSFVKVTPTRYLLENPDTIISQVDKMISELSLGNPNDYEENINKYLFDTMLSRRVSSEFMKSNTGAFDLVNFITIDIKLPDRTLTVSTGSANFGTITKKLNGVLYK